ncbi:hypothetical protein WKW50_24085 [Ochrobactrum sp. GPK 3]|uniref:hypothetical protein n=1 Tax=Brucella sp. 22210 TaxID=3453892 RepID=UPI00313858B9
MFKVLVLQALHNLSEVGFQIQDRVSFMRFPGLRIGRQAARRQDYLAVSRTSRAGGAIIS